MRTRNCCHVSVAFVLKLLNYLQAFVGVSIVLYSAWMLDEWDHRVPVSPPPFPAPSPSHALLPLGFVFASLRDILPAPWFIYCFMGVGIILCFVTLIGCIAAESVHGCCLCFVSLRSLPTIQVTLFYGEDYAEEKKNRQSKRCVEYQELIVGRLRSTSLLLEQYLSINDLPFDPTGELENLRSFIEKNVEICKWIGVTVISIQALALLLAMVLRGMVAPRRTDLEDEDEDEYEYESRRRTREPLLNHAVSTSGSATLSDVWSSRMREKYGLNSGEKYNLLNPNASASMRTK